MNIFKFVGPFYIRLIKSYNNFFVLRRCSTHLANYYTDLKASFAQQLSQSETPLPILYGVLVSLCHLGGQVHNILFYLEILNEYK